MAFTVKGSCASNLKSKSSALVLNFSAPVAAVGSWKIGLLMLGMSPSGSRDWLAHVPFVRSLSLATVAGELHASRMPDVTLVQHRASAFGQFPGFNQLLQP